MRIPRRGDTDVKSLLPMLALIAIFLIIVILVFKKQFSAAFENLRKLFGGMGG